MSRKILYPFGRMTIRAFASTMLRYDIQHQGVMPACPKLFVANHPSATDPFLIHLVSKEEVNVMITEKAFRVPVFGWFLHRIKEIPVPLTLEGGIHAIEQAQTRINQGCSVAIFIEGRISPEDGGFLPPRAGAARLALRTHAPVIPVGIYLRRNWRLNIRSGISGEQTEAYWYLHGPYVITVGKPIYLQGSEEDRACVRDASDQIMSAVRQLAAESEARGKDWMKTSWMVTLVRLLAPLRRKLFPTSF